MGRAQHRVAPSRRGLLRSATRGSGGAALLGLALALAVLVAGGLTSAARGPLPAAGAGSPVAAASAAPGGARGGWSVLGLGDSVTSGYHCGCTPFVEQYAELTARATGREVSSTNLGRAGLTTAGLLGQLATPTAARAVAAANIVLVTIGANDVVPALQAWSQGSCGSGCLMAAAAQVEPGVQQALARVRALRTGSPTEILVTTYWNVVEDGEVARASFSTAYQQASDALTRAVNAAICRAATAVSATCVDLYAPFKGGGDRDPTPLLASDGDHPDADGHALIARTLLAAGWAALRAGN